MKYLFNIILFLLFFNNSFAHKNVSVRKEFGNIKVQVTSGFFYEEINKGLVIGMYAEKLSKELNYSEPITLWLRHNYERDVETKYYLNKDSKGLRISIKDRNFSISKILKFIKQSIKNSKKIESIDKKILFKILSKKDKQVAKILTEKIYRPDIVEQLLLTSNVSYYIKNEKFYLYRIIDKKEKILIVLDNLFQLSDNGEYSLLVFESVDHFINIPNNRLLSYSKKVEIENVDTYYKPYRVYNISGGKCIISFRKLSNRESERVMLYLFWKNSLIQDLNKFLKIE